MLSLLRLLKQTQDIAPVFCFFKGNSPYVSLKQGIARPVLGKTQMGSLANCIRMLK